MTDNVTPLERDYSVHEVAAALGMSERWIRRRISEGAEHQRYGHKIAFTAEQVEKLRAKHVTIKVKGRQQPGITTSRGKRSA